MIRIGYGIDLYSESPVNTDVMAIVNQSNNHNCLALQRGTIKYFSWKGWNKSQPSKPQHIYLQRNNSIVTISASRELAMKSTLSQMSGKEKKITFTLPGVREISHFENWHWVAFLLALYISFCHLNIWATYVLV